MLTTEEYRILWNGITEALEKLEEVKAILIKSQQKAEDIVINNEE